MTAALVPVKRLRSGKSRLLGDFDREALERLTLAMLEDVVATLQGVRALDPVAVVTPDRTVADAAQRCGARPILLPDPGLNPSLDAAGQQLAAEGAGALLVILGDVAGALPGEVETLLVALRELGDRGIVLVPARDGGTGALLRAPHDAIPNRFGPGSASAHRDLAKRSALPFRELSLPSLALDLDRREDLERFLTRSAGGNRTRALLRELGIGGER